MASIRWPSTGIPTYATASDLPTTASDGQVAVVLDTDTLYIFNAESSTWIAVGGSTTVLSIGAIDSVSPSANGAVITGNDLVMQSASGTRPGLVNNTTQTFSGDKTFGNIFASIFYDNSAGGGSAGGTGPIRIKNNHAISWQNAGDSADFTLKLDASNILQSSAPFNSAGNITGANLSGTNTGNVTLTAVGAVPNANGASLSGQALTLQPANTSFPGVLTAADWNTFNNKQPAGSYITALTGMVTASGPGSATATIANDVITNAMINSAAAIAYSKLNLSGSIINTDINASAAIAYSKLNLSGSIVNADISNSAAIAYSKLNLSGSIVNTDINASAAIAFSKLASLTSAHILVGSAGNVATDVAVTGDITISNAGVTAIGANKVLDTMIRQSAGLSVIGRSANTTGNVADITAATDGNILRRSGTSIGFGSIDLAAAGAVGASILGVANGGTGAASLTAHGVVIGNTTSAVNVTSAGTAGQVLTSNGASADPTFQTSSGTNSSSILSNLAFASSVGSSALTISLKGQDGNDPSSSNIVTIGFRNATLTTGSYTTVTVTGALSLVVSSGSTLGQTSAVEGYIYIYAINNAGTVELAVSSSLIQEGGVITTTTEGGAGAADSYTGIYSTTGRSNVPFRLIARIRQTQATAGTWASAGTSKDVYPFEKGSVQSTATESRFLASAYITNSGTPTVSTQDGSFISSITDSGVGDMTINFTAGTFRIAPVCAASVVNLNARVIGLGVASTSSLEIMTRNTAGTATDEPITLICVGAR